MIASTVSCLGALIQRNGNCLELRTNNQITILRVCAVCNFRRHTHAITNGNNNNKKNKSLIREINWVHWDHNFCIAIKTNVMRARAMIVRQFDIMLDEMYHQIGQSFYMSHFAEWHGLRSAQLINDKRKMIEIIDLRLKPKARKKITEM